MVVDGPSKSNGTPLRHAVSAGSGGDGPAVELMRRKGLEVVQHADTVVQLDIRTVKVAQVERNVRHDPPVAPG